MTIRMLNLSRALHCALLAAMLLCPFALAHAQAKPGGARAYWCKSPNGAPAMQLESCAPGTEVRSEPLGPHGSLGVKQPPEAAPTAPGASAAARSAPAAAARSAPAAEGTVTVAGKQLGRGAVKTGLLWLVILLGLGLAAGLIGRQLGRSFWRSAAVGGLVWVAVVAVMLVKS